MSFLSDIQRIADAKQALYQVLIRYGSTLTTSDLIDLYASEFARIISEATADGATYYKCTAVDTESGTWAGRKAVWDGAYYTFEDTDTTGLTFGSIVPVVDKIYNNTTTVTVEHLYSVDDMLERYAIQAEAAQAVAEESQSSAAKNAAAVSDNLAEVQEYSNTLSEIIG